MASRNLIQTWVASGVLLNLVSLGMMLSFPSCLLPALTQGSPDDIQTDLDTASWLASVFGLAVGPGTVASWLLMDWRGRRFAHAALMGPGILGWLLIYFTPNVACLMIGRIFGGFSAGCTVNLGATVLGEYTSPQLRGVFLTLKAAAGCIGNIILHMLGHFFHWRTVAFCGFAVNLTAFIIVWTWPESPAWLASKKNIEASAKSFFFLRGHDEKSEKEFDDLIKAQTNTKSKVFSFKVFINRFLQKDFRKPFLIAIMANVLLESSGRHYFPAYAVQIIEEVVGGKSLYVVVGIDSLALLGASLAALLARSVRRRVLLLSSVGSALLVLSIFCIYSFLSAYHFIKDSTHVSIGLLIIYFIMTSIGCSPMPLVLIGEIFPLAHRGTGPALLGTVMSLYMMLLLKIVPFLMMSLKVYGMLGIFGVAMAGSGVVLYFILPETKDRTLQEIEDYFNNGYFLEDAGQEEMRMIGYLDPISLSKSSLDGDGEAQVVPGQSNTN